MADGLITKIRNERGQAGGVFARLAVGGVFLQSSFDSTEGRRERPKSCCHGPALRVR